MKWLLEDQRTLAKHYTKNAVLRTHPQQFLLLLKENSSIIPEKNVEEVGSPVDSGVAESDEGSESGGRFEDCELSRTGEGVARKRVSWHEDLPTSPVWPLRLPRERSHTPASALLPGPPPLPASDALQQITILGGCKRNRGGGESKAGLLRRFLRSLPELKKKKRPLWSLPSAPPDAVLDDQSLPEVEEALVKAPPLPHILPPPALRNVLCCDTIHRVYKVADMEGEALLCVLTENKLFLMGAMGDGSIKKCLDYRDLQATIMGPGEEVVVIAGREGWRVTFAVAGRLASDLCCRLHWASSASPLRPLALPPPSSLSLTLRNMEALALLISTHTKNEGAESFGYIWAIVEQSGGRENRGRKEGELMVALGPKGKWTAGRVWVREGRVAVATADGEKREWSGVSLEGCRRVSTSRPHTLLASFGSQARSVVLAAPDDYEAAAWMEAILTASSPPSPPSSGPALLLLTSSSLCACPYPHTAVSASTPLEAIAVVHTGPTTCTLELGCGEAREGEQSDWNLTFLCEESLKDFVRLLLDKCPTITQRLTGRGPSPLDTALEGLLSSYSA